MDSSRRVSIYSAAVPGCSCFWAHPRILCPSLKTMQTHVNEVTVIHTLVNTVRFLAVISKHGTGFVTHKGVIKKEDSALV